MSPPRALLLPAILLAATNLSIALLIAAHNPLYFTDYHRNTNPDAIDYARLGENLWQRGAYSRQDGPPYAPDILRTPLYPVVAGAAIAPSGAVWPLYAFQFVLSAGTLVVLFSLAGLAERPRAAVLAAALLAADWTLATLNFQAMSEVLFVALSTLAIFVWVRAALHPGTLAHPARWWAAAGLLLGLATLTRPAGLYLPIAVAAAGAAVGLARRQRLAMRGPALLLVVSCLVVAPWVVRNSLRFSLARLTTADTINLLYFAGAGAYQVHDGIDREEAQRRIAARYDVPTLVESNNFWLADVGVAEMDAAQRRAALDIIASYPVAFAGASAIGLVKSVVAHSTGELAAATGLSWRGPGESHLMRGDFGGLRRALREEHPFLLLVFAWQVAVAIGTALLAAVGAVRMLTDRRARMLAFLLLLVVAYHLATVAVVGIDAYARHRAPVLPFVYLFAAVALAGGSARPADGAADDAGDQPSGVS